MKNFLLYCSVFMMVSATTASGQWQKVYTYDVAPLVNIHAFNADKAIVSGSESYLLMTHDGGTTWDTIDFSNSWDFEIQFLNDTLGFIGGYAAFPVGPTYYKTIDGGLSWQPINFVAGGDAYRHSLCFISEMVGWASNYFELYKTTDGGDTFIPQPIDTSGYNAINDIVFINPDTGFLATQYKTINTTGFTENRIYRTVDQGASWQIVYEDDDMGNNSFVFAGITKIFFVDQGNGFAVGGEGKILKTDNGGNTWQPVVSSFQNDVTDIDFLTVNKGYVATGGMVYYTDDGMATWHLQQSDESSYNIYYLSILNDSTGYASGHGIFKTSNGGGVVTGVSENMPLTKSLKVYPNPANSTVYLEYGNNVRIKEIHLTDASGRLITTFKASETVLDVSGIAAGFYNLQITTAEGVICKKISIY